MLKRRTSVTTADDSAIAAGAVIFVSPGSIQPHRLTSATPLITCRACSYLVSPAHPPLTTTSLFDSSLYLSIPAPFQSAHTSVLYSSSPHPSSPSLSPIRLSSVITSVHLISFFFLHRTILGSPSTPLTASLHHSNPPNPSVTFLVSPGVLDSPFIPLISASTMISRCGGEQTKGSSAPNAFHFYLSIYAFFPPSNFSLHLSSVCLFAGSVVLPWRPDLAVWSQWAAAARSG